RIPKVAPNDHGFRSRPVAALPFPPRNPKGFTVSFAGSGPDGQAILYTRGALPILVRIDSTSPLQVGPQEEVDASVEGLPARVILPLYGVPTITFRSKGHSVSISTALDVQGLTELAEAMYPA